MKKALKYNRVSIWRQIDILNSKITEMYSELAGKYTISRQDIVKVEAKRKQYNALVKMQ